jgi:hypothetical protein
MTFQDDKLYSCGEEGGQVAGLVRYDKDVGVITWVNPGGRQRAYELDKIETDEPDRLEFVDKEGRRFLLEQLTPSFYNANVRRARDPHLMSDVELLAAFEQSLA